MVLRQPVQQRGKDTRDKILDVAARLFAENGYSLTEVMDIVKAGEVSRGAVYHYFKGGKQDVAHAVATESFVMDDLPSTDGPRLQSVVDASILLAVAAPQVTVVRAAMRIALEQGHPLYGFLWDTYIPLVEGWLTEARDRGELMPGVVPHQAATGWVDGYTGRDARYRHRYEELPEAVAQLNMLMVRAIATPETMMKVDLSVERGRRLFTHSRWASQAHPIS
ncbi:TetR/AcrR family transcriptional regulator [Streptomyces sp. NBC_00637]|uniref:TetR family transcriptional regulator n=1 Tax=Streptomyces sp. NBC_00637 TaxID=2903667 RepID=UPI003255396D